MITIYLNSKRYVRSVRRTRDITGQPYSTMITFAYRGIPAEWPTVITYTIR